MDPRAIKNSKQIHTMDAAGGATRAKIRYPEESDNYARKYSEDEASENKNVEW